MVKSVRYTLDNVGLSSLLWSDKAFFFVKLIVPLLSRMTRSREQ